VHWQNRLLSIQVDLHVTTFAGLEDRALTRKPTPELLARHRLNINNFVTQARPRLDAANSNVFNLERYEVTDGPFRRGRKYSRQLSGMAGVAMAFWSRARL
jgi:hypothetical protein